jgi:hypothetical protein
MKPFPYAVAVALAVVAALAPSAAAWGPREEAPTLNTSIIQPDSSMVLRDDGSAAYLARGLDVGSDDATQLVVRSPGGPAAFASPFPSGFGQYSTTSNLFLTAPDAAGNLLVVRQPNPGGVALLTPGADPAGVTVVPQADRISHVDLAPSGEAAAIVGGGSTAGVSFRATGPNASFDARRELDRLGQMRSYGLGVTLDADGGVFVVYRTEQAAGILQAYAPPGGDFGAPVQIDAPAAPNDVASFAYVQSTNGRGMLVWSENVSDNSNRDQVWAATRQPGGLLGAKSLVVQKTAANRLVDVTSAGITDDGTQYVGILDADPVSGCPGNADLDRGGVIAKRSGSGPWELTREQGAWPNTSSIGRIATAGNRVGVIVDLDDDSGARCETTDAASRVQVRLGQGGSLGGPVTVASDSVSHPSGNALSVQGFAVNSAGNAILLTSEPQSGSDRKRFLYFHQDGGGAPIGPPLVPAPGPGPGPDPGPSTKPLPAPGKINLSGKKLIARDGEVPFEASCARLGPGDRVYCRIDAILLEQVKREAKARGAAKPKKGKSKRKAKQPKPKILARGRLAKLAAGKTGTVELKLNAVGGKRLKKARKGVPATLRVTIRKGATVTTVERKVTLKAGKAKKKKGRGKRKR